MAETITIEEIKEVVPAASNVPDFLLQAYIDQMNEADVCLDALDLTDDQEKAVKMAGVLHILELAARGGVQSDTTKTGASRSYFDADSINSTQYGIQLQTLSGGQCIAAKMGSDSRVAVFALRGLSRNVCR